MKFRQAITEERANGVWLKYHVELEEPDIEASAAEMGLRYDWLSVMQRFNFARLLCATLLYSAVVADHPLAEPELIEARTRFTEYRSKLLDSQKLTGDTDE